MIRTFLRFCAICVANFIDIIDNKAVIDRVMSTTAAEERGSIPKLIRVERRRWQRLM